MITPGEWDVILRPGAHRGEAFAWVAKYVREVLQDMACGKIMTTNDLVEALYPRDAVKSVVSDDARTSLYSILSLHARRELSDCCTKGPIEGEFRGRPKRPWHWHRPKERAKCPHCGQVIDDPAS